MTKTSAGVSVIDGLSKFKTNFCKPRDMAKGVRVGRAKNGPFIDPFASSECAKERRTTLPEGQGLRITWWILSHGGR